MLGGKRYRYPRLERALRSDQHDYQDNEINSADILVTYSLSPDYKVSNAPFGNGLAVYELLVTDQRDRKMIATMRYIIDQDDRRICGPIRDNVLSENAFLAKALALE